MVNLHQLAAAALILVVVWGSQLPEPKDFTIVKAERVVTLNGNYPSQTTKIQYRCLLNICPLSFRHIIPTEYDRNIVKITFGKDKTDPDELSYSKGGHQHDGKDYAVYDINIKQELMKDEVSTMLITVLFINRYENFPSTITLSEDQKLQYEDNKYFVSMYDVTESSIFYKFSRILSFDDDGEKKGLSTVFFRKTDYPSYMADKHIVHGVNNEPQVVFTSVERIVEISHWGNIAITQFYKIKNTGPSLKGEFSRVQFGSNNKFQNKNAWKGIQTQLPYKTWGLYYRDEVGNISTSKAYRDDRNELVKVGFIPRFALLGGWKSNWEIGYNLNTDGYLKVDKNHFQLGKIPLGYALSKIMAESYSIKVILPEGCTNAQIYIGANKIDMNSVEKGVDFGYLDFDGRPTYRVDSMRGIFDGKQLTVTYEQNVIDLVKKPLYLFGTIFCVLSLIVVVKRLNFSAFEEHSKLS